MYLKTEKQKVKEITDKLEEGLKELFESGKYKNYLSTMSKFHNYSVNNTLLIALQRPDASLVAGYQAWQKNFNRHVNKGEKGIRILAPAPYKIKEWALLWQLLLGIGLGILLFLATFLIPMLIKGRILGVNTFVPKSTRSLILFTLFNQFLFVGPIEETVYRGYLLDRLREATNSKWIAVLLMTAVFVFSHSIGTGFGTHMVSHLVLALVTAFVRLKFKLGSIFALGVAHALSNSLLQLSIIYLFIF